MKFSFKAYGHSNVTSKHKTTFEITTDSEIGISADCIIGVSSEKSMLDFSKEFKDKIRSKDAHIRVFLETKNAKDEIRGWGHPNLILSNKTDLVCRKSNYICDRTLMIKSDKAACDLNKNLIKDLSEGQIMFVEIKVD